MAYCHLNLPEKSKENTNLDKGSPNIESNHILQNIGRTAQQISLKFFLSSCDLTHLESVMKKLTVWSTDSCPAGHSQPMESRTLVRFKI